MIDFRYHLVSLAAVLIALSIGIVLGAGPLNDNIGSTLSGEVTKLRRGEGRPACPGQRPAPADRRP